MAQPPLAAPPDIGGFIRGLRRKRNLTVEDLASRSGVSKSLVSQIERNRTNPTLGTIWRLCGALGIGVHEIFGGEDGHAGAVDLVTAHATPTIRSSDGKCQLRILGPMDLGGLVEWYEVQADPGAELVSEAHDPGTAEHLSLLEGTLDVESGEERQTVTSGETARYAADRSHAIRNRTDAPARALLVVMLRRPGS